MEIGVMNNPSQSVEAQVRAIGKAGFDFVDLTMEGPEAREIDPDRIKPLLEQYNLSVVGHTDPCLPWAYPVKGVRKACHSELERCARVFSALGAKVMNIHPCYASPPGARLHTVRYNAQVLPGLVDMAQDFGLTLALENFTPPFDTVSRFRMLMKNAPGLGLHLDVGHCNIGRNTAGDFLRKLGKHLVHVHFSDNRGTADHHMPLGVGNIHWESVVQDLKNTGYDKTITLEVFCGNRDMQWTYLEASRKYVRKLWEKT